MIPAIASQAARHVSDSAVDIAQYGIKCCARNKAPIYNMVLKANNGSTQDGLLCSCHPRTN